MNVLHQVPEKVCRIAQLFMRHVFIYIYSVFIGKLSRVARQAPNPAGWDC